MENLQVIEKNKSVYIHIPFCDSICSYCDFCKFIKNEKWIYDYLEELNNEIKQNYKGEIINTIYIGGGTPSCLDIKQLNKLFEIIKIFKISKNIEFTFECNIENITQDKLKLFFNKLFSISFRMFSFAAKSLPINAFSIHI